MRFLVLALMIVLLPLRGWAGDAMAIEMAGQAVAIESAATSVHEMGAKKFFDHQNQTLKVAVTIHDCQEQAAGLSEADQAANDEHCGTCPACQACHTVGLSSSPFQVMASFASPQLRPTRTAAFTSASAALGQKPPIS